MRIITGYLKGQTFNTPNNKLTHPMSEKIRGALFNILGNINGLRILDAYAGSGAISFEALSRSAALVTAIESDRLAQKVIAKNIQKLGLGNSAKLIKASAKAWLTTSYDIFDVVILDPPYNNLQQTVLLGLADRTKIGGIVVLSVPPQTEINWPDNYHLIKCKSYGDAQLRLYRKDIKL